MFRFLIAAPRKSSGKTTFAAGLCAELRRRGRQVQPFKKGPDYIDSGWLGRAAGRACYNLDFRIQTIPEIFAAFGAHTDDETVAVVEGNMALHDGLDAGGKDSNAALAKMLAMPVVLVIDCAGFARSVAALALGFSRFDPELRVAGVVLNQVAGARHEEKLRAAMQAHTDIPVLAALPRAKPILPERHLGLIPGNESAAAAEAVAAMRKAVAAGTDIDALLAAVGDQRHKPLAPGEPSEHASPVASPIPIMPISGPAPAAGAAPGAAWTPLATPPQTFRLGVFRDAAFGFYYPDDLAALERQGAELLFIDSLRDTALPPIDALFIGGGFPETQAPALAANAALRAQVNAAIAGGLPAYAECGGLMYLARSIAWRGRRCEMAGVIPADAVLHDAPQGRGYVEIAEGDMPWPPPRDQRRTHPAHEFHHSTLENIDPQLVTVYKLTRGRGIGDGRDGIVVNNLLASYAHRRATPSNDWTERFAAFVRKVAGRASAAP